MTTHKLRIKRPRGPYAAQLCATTTAGPTAFPTCALKRVRARRGRLTLPALTLHAGEGQRVRVRLTLRSLTHRASATTRGTVLLDL